MYEIYIKNLFHFVCFTTAFHILFLNKLTNAIEFNLQSITLQLLD